MEKERCRERVMEKGRNEKNTRREGKRGGSTAKRENKSTSENFALKRNAGHNLFLLTVDGNSGRNSMAV